MIEFKALNKFLDIVDSDLETTFHEKGESVSNYTKYIRQLYRDIMEESRSNLTQFARLEDKYVHFRDMIRKVIDVEDHTFQKSLESGNIIYLRYRMEINRDGNVIEESAFILFTYVQETKDYFQTCLPKDPQDKLLPRSGFVLVNKSKDYEPIFRMLVERDLISEVSENAFHTIFWDGKFNEPIIWLDGKGLLMYFVRQLERRGIVSPLGKTNLNSTILCFRNKNVEKYTKNQLQRSKVPKNKHDIDEVLDSF
jgi:hypothetical protein